VRLAASLSSDPVPWASRRARSGALSSAGVKAHGLEERRAVAGVPDALEQGAELGEARLLLASREERQNRRERFLHALSEALQHER
jgi:hypothetical protein